MDDDFFEEDFYDDALYNEAALVAIDSLKRIIEPGVTIYSTYHGELPGKTTEIRLVTCFITYQGHPRTIDNSLSDLFDIPIRKGHLAVEGSGYDIGADLTQQLASALFGNAHALKSQWL